MTAKQVMEKLKQNGWTQMRINGSHHVFAKAGCRPIPVPVHGNSDMGIMAERILKEAGLNV
jgi:predicted RNA binding protein YcfA (HicA-like mRNA interferase family)